MAQYEFVSDQRMMKKRQRKFSEMQQLVDLIQENQSKSEQFISRVNELLDLTSGEEGSRSNSMVELYQQLISFEIKNQEKYRNLNEQLSNWVLKRVETLQARSQASIQQESDSLTVINAETKRLESKTIQVESQTLPTESQTIRESYSIPHDQVIVGEAYSPKRKE